MPATLTKTEAKKKDSAEGAANNSEENTENPSSTRRPCFKWNVCQEYLLEWLCMPVNFDRWRSTAVAGRRTGDSKVQIAEELAELLRSKGFPNADGKRVQNKIEVWEGSYKRAVSCLNGTGYGIEEKDIKRGITTIEQKVKSLCPFFDQLNEVFGGRPGMVPPYTAGSESAPEELPDIFGDEDTITAERNATEDQVPLLEEPKEADNDAPPPENTNVEEAERVPTDGIQIIDMEPPPQPAAKMGQNSRAREKPGILSSALSPLQKNLAPSQQRKLNKCGKNASAASSIDALLAERKDYWDHKMELNVKRQKLAEAKADKEHEIRLKELAIREKEAEAAKEQAKAQTLLMQFFIEKMQKS